MGIGEFDPVPSLFRHEDGGVEEIEASAVQLKELHEQAPQVHFSQVVFVVILNMKTMVSKRIGCHGDAFLK